MDIQKYTSLFHDGSITCIDHIDNELVISMESAEVAEEDLHEDIPLSVHDRIKGKLRLKGINSIKEGKSKKIKPIDVKMKTIDAEIFHMEITKNKVKLQIIWDVIPVNIYVQDFLTWEIECNEVFWENIPE